MLGQEKFLGCLDMVIQSEKMPRFSIVIAERGMESEDVGRYIANKLGADYIQFPDVKVDTVRDMIKQAYKAHKTTIYNIPNADDMSVNAKNALLKVTEEPPNRAYFVMCLEDTNNTLATIRSRAVIYYMDRCKPEDIKDYARELYVNKKDVDEDSINLIGKICSTPGEVRMLQKYGAKNFYSYVEYVADRIAKVSGAEMFTLLDRIAYKDEEDKYDCKLFLKAFQSIVLESCEGIQDSCDRYCGCLMSSTTGIYLHDLRIKGINKQMLMENWMLSVRQIYKQQNKV